jgi:hypothetical protein
MVEFLEGESRGRDGDRTLLGRGDLKLRRYGRSTFYRASPFRIL